MSPGRIISVFEESRDLEHVVSLRRTYSRGMERDVRQFKTQYRSGSARPAADDQSLAVHRSVADHSRVPVDNRREVHEPFGKTNVGQVDRPDLIRSIDRCSAKQVRVDLVIGRKPMVKRPRKHHTQAHLVPVASVVVGNTALIDEAPAVHTVRAPTAPYDPPRSFAEVRQLIDFPIQFVTLTGHRFAVLITPAGENIGTMLHELFFPSVHLRRVDPVLLDDLGDAFLPRCSVFGVHDS